MTIRIAGKEDIPTIHKLAHETWWPAYQKILSEEQISFMLEKMYSYESLEQQFEQGHHFALAERPSGAAAFASWSCTDAENGIFKLHKIYIHPSEQGKGTGKKLITRVGEEAKNNGGKILELNVNRENPAFFFYRKMGFEVVREEDIPYYSFFMNDYIMQKTLTGEN